MNETSSNRDSLVSSHERNDRCKYRQCGRPLQVVRGHRQREYCGDLCRQAEFRARRDDLARARIEAERQAQERAELEALHTRYGDLLPDTLRYLLQVKRGAGQDQADQIAAVIASEVNRDHHVRGLRESVNRVTERLQQRTSALEQALEDQRTVRQELTLLQQASLVKQS